MYQNSILTILYVFLATNLVFDSINGQIVNVKPNITVARQINETHIELAWFLDNSNDYSLTRYRILYTTDNWATTLQEWPAQALHVYFNTEDTISINIRTNNYFECFNECIKEPTCVYALRDNHRGFAEDCYFKSTANLTIEDTIPEDYEAIMLSDYSNSVIINNIPYNQIYKFKVAVFDNKTQSWSQFSESSDSIDMRIKLSINFDRTGLDAGIIHVNQTNTNNYVYDLSRCQFKISENGGEYTDSNSLFISSLTDETFQQIELEPKYYETTFKGPNATIYDNVTLDFDCFIKCTLMPNCVQFIYFFEKSYTDNIDENTCILVHSLNITNGLKASRHSKIKSVKNSISQVYLKYLIPDTYYQFKLECLTPYDSQVSSNEFGYYFSYLKPYLSYTLDYTNFTVKLNWTVKENVGISRYNLFSTSFNSYGHTYIYDSAPDYEDKDEMAVSAQNMDNCYLLCFEEPKCVAFTWTWVGSLCIMKTNKDNPKPCQSPRFCGAIPIYKNEIAIPHLSVNTEYCYQIYVRSDLGFDGEYSERVCVKFDFDVKIVAESDFLEGHQANLTCAIDGLGQENIAMIQWLKGYRPINVTLYNATIMNDGRVLHINSLSHKMHIDHYSCELFFKNGETYTSQDQFQILIPFDTNIYIESPTVYYVNETNWIRLTCILESYPLGDKRIAFKHENNGSDITSDVQENIYVTNITMWWFIGRVSVSDNGTIICYDKTNESMQTRMDLVVLTKPPKPILLSAEILEKTTIIKWKKFQDPYLKLLYLLIEWSDDFSNSHISAYSKYFSFDDAKSDSIDLEFTVQHGSYVRMTVYNQGGASLSSDPLQVKCGSICSKHTEDKYFTPFITVIVLAAFVVLVSISLYCFKVKQLRLKFRAPSSIDTRVYHVKDDDN